MKKPKKVSKVSMLWAVDRNCSRCDYRAGEGRWAHCSLDECVILPSIRKAIRSYKEKP